MICDKCNTKIEVQSGTEITYKAQLINTLVGACVASLKSGRCQSRCTEKNCQFKPLHMNRKLTAAEKRELKKNLKEFLGKTIKVKPKQPYCSKGTKIYCMKCRLKVTGDEK